jgi:hypothetical protein
VCRSRAGDRSPLLSPPGARRLGLAPRRQQHDGEQERGSGQSARAVGELVVGEIGTEGHEQEGTVPSLVLVGILPGSLIGVRAVSNSPPARRSR